MREARKVCEDVYFHGDHFDLQSVGTCWYQQPYGLKPIEPWTTEALFLYERADLSDADAGGHGPRSSPGMMLKMTSSYEW